MKVISYFDHTGNMVKPWAEAGYDCYTVDIVTSESMDNVTRIKHDLSVPWLPPFDKEEVAAFFAFPPCDHLAVSGARWFKGKGLRLLSQAINLFATAAEFAEWCGAPYLIENPVSTISTYWRKPDHTFDPCDYGDPYTKKTCLWVGGGLRMPEKTPVEPAEGSKMHLLPPSKDRAALRSATPMGFAKAIFEANKEGR